MEQTAAKARFDRECARQELADIASWWLEHSVDFEHDGFAGMIDSQGRPVAGAAKGLVLNCRILWFFSTLCQLSPVAEYRDAATRAFHYNVKHFDDQRYPGAVWRLTHEGQVADDRKQVYGLAFAIYAFSAYFEWSADPVAREKALDYFHVIEARALDARRGGYFEGFSRDWVKSDPRHRQSGDKHGPKPMNTILHLLEAYTALYRATRSQQVEDALRNILDLFSERIVDPASGHLRRLFDGNWNVISPRISFGHDIEASWLLCQAAGELGDDSLENRIRPLAVRLAENCLKKGLTECGRVSDQLDPWTGRLSAVGVWWVQAEAIVGFLNAWRLTGNDSYREAVDRVWCYVEGNLKDHQQGEWFPQYPTSSPGRGIDYKAGQWKGPYHNGRAMIEACRIFDAAGAQATG